jgi:hypothetical protein
MFHPKLTLAFAAFLFVLPALVLSPSNMDRAAQILLASGALLADMPGKPSTSAFVNHPR